MPALAQAQPAPGAHRIGFLAARSRSTASNPDPYYDAFLEGMRELGYVEGRNLVVEWRFAEQKYDRLPELAADLVRTGPAVIVTHGTPPTAALQRATSTIPIVSAAVSNPVASGFAVSLARPGGNISGLSLILADLSAKKLELLKALMPGISRVAVFANPGNPSHPVILKNAEGAGRQFGITVLRVDVSNPEQIDHSFDVITREHAQAIWVQGDPSFIAYRMHFASLAVRLRLPSIFDYREDVLVGGLMSYGQRLADFYHRAATYVDKILKGVKTADLPWEQPMKLHLAINRKTASVLGLAVPKDLLLRADEIIE